MPTLDDLNAQLDALEASLHQMIEDYPDPSDFWPEFAGAAATIEDMAGEHCDVVHERIAAMLAKHGRYIAFADAEPETTNA